MTTRTAHRLTPPRRYLVRMTVFVVLAGFLVFIQQKLIWSFFMNNPGLNGLIVGVLAIGILLAFRQVIRLFREIRWANAYAEPGTQDETIPKPVLLMPMATILGGRTGQGVSTVAMRSILDSVGLRLDESRDISRYLTGLLIFLGLLGTFWGLLETVSSVGTVIGLMKTGGDAASMFDDLKRGLAAPLAGMGISFSSSMFGLAGSLVLGFLDLQASQAQNRFYNELEDWLSSEVTDVSVAAVPAAAPVVAAAEVVPAAAASVLPAADIRMALDRLSATVSESAGNRATTAALANLAEGIQALVHHMRAEQQMIRDWVEAQAGREREIQKVLERIAAEYERR
jgi:hypothetical protein